MSNLAAHSTLNSSLFKPFLGCRMLHPTFEPLVHLSVTHFPRGISASRRTCMRTYVRACLSLILFLRSPGFWIHACCSWNRPRFLFCFDLHLPRLISRKSVSPFNQTACSGFSRKAKEKVDVGA